MKLSRRDIQRMILREGSSPTVINQSSEGGGGGGSQPSITLGPLLTSLNAEAMPVSEGYLHWTGSAWTFDTPTGGDPVDLTPYAQKTWVQNNFAYKSDLANFITLNEAQGLFAPLSHTHNNYLPLTAGSSKPLTGSLYITGNAGITWVGGIGMMACQPESGWTGISSTQWGVGALSSQGVIRSNASDLLHYRNNANYKIWDAYNFTPSDYLPLTGGTVESLTVTNGLDADSITVSSLVNSDTLAEYLDADAMQTWGDGRYLKLAGGTMEPGATITLQEIENNIPVQTLVASQRWVNSRGFLTSAALSGYATTSQLNTGLAAKQNKIHFLDTKHNNTELDFSYLYLPLSNDGGGHVNLDLSDYATKSAWKVKDVDVIYHGASGAIINGDEIPYLVELNSSGELEVHCGYLNIWVPDKTSDLTNDSGFITSSALSNYWNVNTFKGVKVGNTTYSPQTNGTGAGWIDITDEFSYIGSTISGKVSQNGDSMSGDLTMVGGSIYFKRISGGSVDGAILASTVTPSGYQSAVGCITIGGNVNFDNDGAPPMAAGKWLATQEWVTSQLGGYLPLTGGTLSGNLVMNGASITFGPSDNLAAIIYSSGALRIGAAAVAVSSDGVFTFNGEQVATQPWVNSRGFLTSAALSGYATQSWVNGRGFASAQDLYDLGTLVTTDYLPLTAGSSKPLTGGLYINHADGLTINAQVSTDSTKWHDINMYWRGDVFNMYAFETRYWDLCIGCVSDMVSNYNGLYYDGTNKRWGIGTNAPGSALHVANECRFAKGAKFANICIEVNNSTSSSSRDSEINNYNTALYLQHNSSTNCYIRTGGGNLGIGTTQPAYKLDVNGDAAVGTNLSVGGNADIVGGLNVVVELNVGDVTNGGLWLSDSEFGVWSMSGTTRQDTTLMSFASSGVTLSGDMIVTGKMAVNALAFDGTNTKLQVGGNIAATGSITAKSNQGNVQLANGHVSANDLYITNIIFGSGSNDPKLYVSNGHLYFNSTMIV